MSSLLEIFSAVPDHRGRKGRRYSFVSVMLLVTLGLVCGCNNVTSIARFAKDLSVDIRKQPGFSRWRIPSQPMLCLFFQGVDVDALERTLMRFAPKGQTLSLDGKRLCGSISEENPRAVHLLACFAGALGMVTGQTRQKSGNEVTAALELLRSMDLQDSVITGDAMFANREICETIRNKGGHYAFTVKDNQKPLKKAIEHAFSL